MANLRFKVGDHVKPVRTIKNEMSTLIPFNRVARIIRFDNSNLWPIRVEFLAREFKYARLIDFYGSNELKFATEDEILVEMI